MIETQLNMTVLFFLNTHLRHAFCIRRRMPRRRVNMPQTGNRDPGQKKKPKRIKAKNQKSTKVTYWKIRKTNSCTKAKQGGAAGSSKSLDLKPGSLRITSPRFRKSVHRQFLKNCNLFPVILFSLMWWNTKYTPGEQCVVHIYYRGQKWSNTWLWFFCISQLTFAD